MPKIVSTPSARSRSTTRSWTLYWGIAELLECRFGRVRGSGGRVLGRDGRIRRVSFPPVSAQAVKRRAGEDEREEVEAEAYEHRKGEALRAVLRSHPIRHESEE